ncbi:hypothetical protein QAD02_021326 [Eretmocerus hayati]|uniref:Uncharacterized protein n=1 Tax=Eretmocerus hayati TaxID=131215 RepID=A0ACC2PQZ5_9HYME|nr:hypothetical protein QAD02_021326 [Eretmocerus hayati]
MTKGSLPYLLAYNSQLHLHICTLFAVPAAPDESLRFFSLLDEESQRKLNRTDLETTFISIIRGVEIDDEDSDLRFQKLFCRACWPIRFSYIWISPPYSPCLLRLIGIRVLLVVWLKDLRTTSIASISKSPCS